MKNRNPYEEPWLQVALLFISCWVWVFIFYNAFWGGTNVVSDLVFSVLITLGLLLVVVPGVFICFINKERVSPFMIAGIVFAGVFIYTGYQTYTNARSADLGKNLNAAVRQGDTDSVAKLLDQGADVNSLLDGSTPIMIAVIEGNKETAVLLTERGARLNGVVDLAIKHDRLDMIGTLVLDRNSEQARMQQVNDALTIAATTGNWTAVKQLLDWGGNVNVRDSENATLLMMAAYQDRADVVQDLLRRGADPILRDNHSRSALMYAAEHSRQSSIFRSLLRHGAYVLGKNEEGLIARELVIRTMLLGQWKKAPDKEKMNEYEELLRMLKQAEEEQKAREKS